MKNVKDPGQGHSLFCIPQFPRGQSRLDLWNVLRFAMYLYCLVDGYTFYYLNEWKSVQDPDSDHAVF